MLSKSDTLKLISSINKRGKALDSDIQLAGLSAIYYSICHGDVTVGQKLIENFPQGSRKAAVVSFLETYGQFEAKGKSLVYRAKVFQDEDKNPVTMLEQPELCEAYCNDIKVQWTALKPEKVVSLFDCLDQTKAFIARMEKAIKEGKAQHSEIYDAMATAYNSFLEEHTEDEEQEGSHAAEAEGTRIGNPVIPAEIAAFIQQAA